MYLALWGLGPGVVHATTCFEKNFLLCEELLNNFQKLSERVTEQLLKELSEKKKGLLNNL